MKPLVYQSKKDFSNLDIYQRMVECFASAPITGGRYLDMMNFAQEEFKQVIDPITVEKVFKPEHGYTSPDGSFELSALIKELEKVRLMKNSYLKEKDAAQKISKLACGLGNGVTGVYAGVLWAISQIKEKNRNEVLTFRPSYPVCETLARKNGLKVKPVLTKRTNDFLPIFDDIKNNTNSKTVAVVLVYPNNPTFTTYQDDIELKKIVNHCQKNKIFLIVDNIYQEMIFNGKKHVEIFSVAQRTDYIIKLFGPSKDRPFFTGHRLGYYIGDPRIAESYFDYCVSNFVCLGTFAKNIFALDILFRILDCKEKTTIQKKDINILMPFLKGWMKSIDLDDILGKLKKHKALDKYRKSLKYNNNLLKKTLSSLKKIVEKSKVFIDVINDISGNAIFMRVNPKYYHGDDLSLFKDVLKDLKIIIYPGNVFGMPAKKGSLWFRITIIHTSKNEIINMLKELETYLLKKKK